MIPERDIRFHPGTSAPPYTPGAAEHFHLYEDDDSGAAAVYVDGKAFFAGEWYEVVKELLGRVGVKIFKIAEPEDLWVNVSGEGEAGWEIYQDEWRVNPEERAKRDKARRIVELRHELAELEGAPLPPANPLPPTIIWNGLPSTFTTSGTSPDPLSCVCWRCVVGGSMGHCECWRCVP